MSPRTCAVAVLDCQDLAAGPTVTKVKDAIAPLLVWVKVQSTVALLAPPNDFSHDLTWCQEGTLSIEEQLIDRGTLDR